MYATGTPMGKGPEFPATSSMNMDRLLNLSPTNFQLPTRTGVKLVDKLVEQVGDYLSHRESNDPNHINLANVTEDSFSGTYHDIRERLRSLDDSSATQHAKRNMSVDNMYHVLSMAFLLMEDERKAFQDELKEVEGYFEEKVRECDAER